MRAYPVKIMFTIPDNSGSQSGGDCRISMWGIYKDNGKPYKFYCNFCCMIITVNFPRWSRILRKETSAEDAINFQWVCPGCAKPPPVLELIEEHSIWYDIYEAATKLMEEEE